MIMICFRVSLCMFKMLDQLLADDCFSCLVDDERYCERIIISKLCIQLVYFNHWKASCDNNSFVIVLAYEIIVLIKK